MTDAEAADRFVAAIESLGRVSITDDMIERGASALAHLHEYDPNTIPVQLWPAVRDRYRRDAKTVLCAALDAEAGKERRG